MIIKEYYKDTVMLSKSEYDQLIDIKSRYEKLKKFVYGYHKVGLAAATVYPMINVFEDKDMWDEATKH